MAYSTPEPDVAGLAMGEVFRDARPKADAPLWLGEHRNLYAVTSAPGLTMIPFDQGINAMARLNTAAGSRVPAILIASSPHKVGRTETPWQDVFDTDNGHVRYYGDNRTSGRDPRGARGNAVLLDAFAIHSDAARRTRAGATPLLFFRRVAYTKRQKGYVRFEGFGVISHVERVAQRASHEERSFANYAFDFLVMDLSAENEVFPWSWIRMRRDPLVTPEHSLAAAPLSWRRWTDGGAVVAERVRRRVARRSIQVRSEQLPPPGSPESTLLKALVRAFDGRKEAFEGVAAWVTERVLGKSGDYRHFGVTRRSADGGFDFVGRLDVGSGFGRAKLVILGQAKCETDRTATNGLDVARTVARLRRGWMGVYVTTSYFSEPTQQEVVQDRYPLLLINGKRLAEEVRTAMIDRDTDLSSLLAQIGETHGGVVDISDPDHVLFET